MKSSFRNIRTAVDQYIRLHRLEGYRDIAAFTVITLAIHFGWRFWENKLGLFPVHSFMAGLMDGLARSVMEQTIWLWNNLAGYGVIADGKLAIFPSGYDIRIGRSCSGMKQIWQFILLMVIFRGPWKHKMWFIPIGAILVHATNLLRIFLTGVLSMNHPEWMKFAHDNVLRWLFYLIICALWLYWSKRVAPVQTGHSSPRRLRNGV